MNEQAIKAFLTARSGGIPPEEFAEHILRNYSIQERAALGGSPIEQAFSVITRNLADYHDRKKQKQGGKAKETDKPEKPSKPEKNEKPAPEYMHILDYDDLALMLAYFTDALDDTVDAVFLAGVDEGFLTPERMDELLIIQNAARIMFESVMAAVSGGGAA